ncbi:hypothetical protein MSG28_003030 [Choristoneura fumiferana]|uniref:Uncharacterized protein n=1 Tax=Choristoneura fumiferana TaxID=7141 RepID=A0ACC0JKM6_CHOFU|nr:hypothetical protein MSG28_003030 [Choristoneura fumiferana]
MMDFGEIWAHIKDGLGTISDALGVQWAPYNVPMARRLQTLGAVGWISLILLGEPFSISLSLEGTCGVLSSIMMDFGEIWAHIKDGLGTISDALGVQWAPYNVPMARRLQTLGAVGWISLILLGEPFSIYLYIKLLYSDYWWLAVMYAFREWTGVSPIFPIGRGVFQYSYGLVPLRAPVTTVVGAPMEVQRNLDPTDAEVDAVHAQFTKRLVNLFESEKYKYLKDAEKVHLVIT